MKRGNEERDEDEAIYMGCGTGVWGFIIRDGRIERGMIGRMENELN
jgi:predicted NBD/HSP70 family sugar kinase